VSYEFTTPDEREALATNITVALAAIRMQDAEVHLRIAHRPSSREVAWPFRHTLMGALGDSPPSATRRRTWGSGEVSRMGRSRNTALVLISQNAGDLLNEQVTGTVSRAGGLAADWFESGWTRRLSLWTPRCPRRGQRMGRERG
jgi:hypothetical protein